MSYIESEEKLIELPVIEYIQKNLGYEFINGERLSPEFEERNSYGEKAVCISYVVDYYGSSDYISEIINNN